MKLIVADLDGTLINNKIITKETMHSIKDLQENNYVFTIATGRHMSAASEIIKQLGVMYPVICCNGAYIYDMRSKQVLYQELIEENTAIQAMNMFEKYHLDYLLYTTDKIVSTEKAKNRLMDRIGTIQATSVSQAELKEYARVGILKILVIDEDTALLHKVKQELAIFNDLFPIQSRSDFLDIVHRKANKGNALKILASFLDIPMKECLAIGDQENDISMIEEAKIGIAMGDGSQSLKDKSDFVTKSFEDNGFSYAINKYIFQK